MNPEQNPLDAIGKRHPYRMPKGFMERLTDAVVAATAVGSTHPSPTEIAHRLRNSPWRTLRMAFIGAASAAVVAVGAVALLRTPSQGTSVTVDQAFSNLSDSDQSALLDAYSHELAMDYADAGY